MLLKPPKYAIRLEKERRKKKGEIVKPPAWCPLRQSAILDGTNNFTVEEKNWLMQKLLSLAIASEWESWPAEEDYNLIITFYLTLPFL